MAHEGYEFDPNEPDCLDGDFYCRLCDASMNSEAMWSSHIVGKKHIKKVTQGPRVIFKRKYDEIDDESYDKPPKTERLDAGSRWGSSDFPHKDQEDKGYPKKWVEGYVCDGSNPRGNPEACSKSYSSERYIKKGTPVYGPRNFDEDYPQRPWDKKDLESRNSYLFKPNESYDYGHKNTLSEPDPFPSAAFHIPQSPSLPFKKEIINSLAFEEIINDIIAHRKVNEVADQRVTDAFPLQIDENSRKISKGANDGQDSQQRVDEKILKRADQTVTSKRVDSKAVYQRDNRSTHEKIDEHVAHPRDGNKSAHPKDSDINSRRYDDQDIHQRDTDRGSYERDYDRSSRRKDADKSVRRKVDEKSVRHKEDDKSSHRQDGEKSVRHKDDEKSLRRKDDDKSSHRKDDEKSVRHKDDDKGSRHKSTDDRLSHYRDYDRDSYLRDRDRNSRGRDNRGLYPKSRNEKGSRQRNNDKDSRQRNSEDKGSRQRDSSERNSHVRSNDDKVSHHRSSDDKNICQKVKDKASSDEDIDDKVIKKKISNGKILQLRINSTTSCGKSVDVNNDDNEEYDKELLELLKQYNDDVLLLEDYKEKTKAVKKHIPSVSGNKSSNNKDLSWNEVDPERLSPNELDNILSSYLKPKADAQLKVKNDSPEDIASRLDTLPNKIFLKAVLKKVDNLIIKDWEELNMLSEIIVKAQTVLCCKIPPHLQAAIRQKISGRNDNNVMSQKAPGSITNPVISESPPVSPHSVQISQSNSTQNVPIVSTSAGIAPNSTAIPTHLSESQNIYNSGSVQPLPSVLRNKPSSLEQKSSAPSPLQSSYQLPAAVQNNPVLFSIFQKKCELLPEPKSSSLNSTQLQSQLTAVVRNNQLNMQNNQLPAVIQSNKLPVVQNNRVPTSVQNNIISVFQNKSGVSVEQKLPLLNNIRSEVSNQLMAATQSNPLQPSVLQTLSQQHIMYNNSTKQTSPSIHSPHLQPYNQQYATKQTNSLLSMFLNKTSLLPEQQNPSHNSPQSSSYQPPSTVQNNQPLFSVLQNIASTVCEEKNSVNSPLLQPSNQLPSTAPNNQSLPSVLQKIIHFSEQKSPLVNSSLSESTNRFSSSKQENHYSMNSPRLEPSNKLSVNQHKSDFTNQTSSASAEKLKSISVSANEAGSNISGNTISHLTSKMIDALIAKNVLPSSVLESSVRQRIADFISEKLKQSLNEGSASSSNDKNTLANAQVPCKLDAENLWEKFFIK